MNTFTVKEASDLTNLTVRAIQYKCKEEKIRKKSNRYLITQTHIDKWLSNENKRKNENEDKQSSLVYEEFTVEQYDQLQEVINNYPLKLKDIEYLKERVEDYRNQIEYLKKSLDKRDEVMERLLENLKETMENLKVTTKTIHQRNYIEAKDKGYDT